MHQVSYFSTCIVKPVIVFQISDKEMSLLEERIKRAAKNRPPPSTRVVPQMPTRQPKVTRQGSESAIHKESPKQLEEVEVQNRYR